MRSFLRVLPLAVLLGIPLAVLSAVLTARWWQAPQNEAGTVAGPFVRVLGTAQDGGFPHAACACERCLLARRNPGVRRSVASLAVVLPGESGAAAKVFLIDASPDVREQLDALADVRDAPAGRVDRAPVDGVLLTHAHIGHYLGLAFFGFEAVHPQGLPVYATPRMAEFLRTNGPWEQQVRIGNLALVETPPGESYSLGAGVSVTPLKVPHRDEYADTVGYLLRGPQTTLLYVPDTDSWDAWEVPLPEVLEREGVDVALLDGSFYSPDELPGRPVESIGHPLIAASMELLAERVSSGSLRVLFTHLNHSNPALDADGRLLKGIRARGFDVAADGQEISL